VVDVEHCRLDIGVAHIALNVVKRPRLYGQRSEGMAQVVEDKRMVAPAAVAEPGVLERRVEGGPDCSALKNAPVSEQKTRSSGPVKCSRRLNRSNARAAWSINGTDRTLPDFARRRSPAV